MFLYMDAAKKYWFTNLYIGSLIYLFAEVGRAIIKNEVFNVLCEIC